MTSVCVGVAIIGCSHVWARMSMQENSIMDSYRYILWQWLACCIRGSELFDSS
jgi:hypothetical protein